MTFISVITEHAPRKYMHTDHAQSRALPRDHARLLYGREGKSSFYSGADRWNGWHLSHHHLIPITIHMYIRDVRDRTCIRLRNLGRGYTQVQAHPPPAQGCVSQARHTTPKSRNVYAQVKPIYPTACNPISELLISVERRKT